MADTFGDQEKGPAAAAQRRPSRVRRPRSWSSHLPTPPRLRAPDPRAKRARRGHLPAMAGASSHHARAPRRLPRPWLSSRASGRTWLPACSGAWSAFRLWPWPGADCPAKRIMPLPPMCLASSNASRKLEASRPQSGDANAQALNALDRRVAELEARTSQPPQDLGELTGRVQRLEQSLKTLADTAAKGSAVADAAAVNAEVGEAEQRLQAKIDAALGEGQAANTSALGTIEREVADLKVRIEALAATRTSPDASKSEGRPYGAHRPDRQARSGPPGSCGRHRQGRDAGQGGGGGACLRQSPRCGRQRPPLRRRALHPPCAHSGRRRLGGLGAPR